MNSPRLTGVSPDVKPKAVASYTPEDQAFHRLFPTVPLPEKLVESCPCGLVRKKIARMGKLYVTSLRLCFHSAFLDSPIIVQWEDVSGIEKKSNLLFQGISVMTKANEELSFTAFLSGGTSQIFQLMKTLWSVREKYASSEANTPFNIREDSPDSSSASYSSTESVVSRTSNSTTTQRDPFINIPSRTMEKTPRHRSPSTQSQSPRNLLHESDQLTEQPRLDGDENDKRKIVLAVPSKLPILDKPLDKTDLLGDLRRVFKELPVSEVLVDTFQCSYVSGVHRLGKMFITTNYILFSSVMMEDGLAIELASVDCIVKEQTMMILDGISIRLKTGKIRSFTSFVSRDVVFNTLMHLYLVVKEKTQKNLESLEENNEGPLVFKTTTSVADANLIPTWESLDEFSNVATEYGTALSDYSCFEKEILAPINLPVGKSVLDVFGACFDDGSTVLVRYHEERKDTDNVLENWRPTTDGKSFRGQRQFTCTTPIKAMMGKMYPYVEYQRYALFKVNGTPHLVIQFSSQVSGVMFGDSFRAEALVVFTQTGSDDTAVVSMRAYGHVQFLRSVWIKGKILSTSLSELPECYTRLAAIIIERLKATGQRGTKVEELHASDPISQVSGEVTEKPPLVPFIPYFHFLCKTASMEARVIILVLSALLGLISLFGVLSSFFGGDKQLLLLILSQFSAAFCSIALFVSVQIFFSVYLLLKTSF